MNRRNLFLVAAGSIAALFGLRKASSEGLPNPTREFQVTDGLRQWEEAAEIHRPQTVEALNEWFRSNFDCVKTLSMTRNLVLPTPPRCSPDGWCYGSATVRCVLDHWSWAVEEHLVSEATFCQAIASAWEPYRGSRVYLRQPFHKVTLRSPLYDTSCTLLRGRLSAPYRPEVVAACRVGDLLHPNSATEPE